MSKNLKSVLSVVLCLMLVATMFVGCAEKPVEPVVLKQAEYNTTTQTMPSNWNEFTYADNNDTQIMSYIGSSFFDYDYKFVDNKKFNEDGSINKSVMASINCIVIMRDAIERGTDEAGFKFIKWWMGSTVQGQYANELVALLGPAGKYATANMDAFNDMSWTASELKEIQNQFSNLQAVPEMPGSYIIARNIEFAFLNVYNNDYVPSEALQDYTNTINAEFQRKRDELKRKFFVPSNTK